MLLNEIIKEVGMTKRAVKYYEEKGLLSVDKDSNGYRNYSMQDVKTLKKFRYIESLGLVLKIYKPFWKKMIKVFFYVFIRKNYRKKFYRTQSLKH